MADDDDQRVGRRQRVRADDAYLRSGVAVTELGRRCVAQQRGQRRRRVELAGSGQRGDTRRNRGVRTGRGQIHPADPLAVEVVGPQQPPQRINRGRSGRRRCLRAGIARLQPGVARVLGVECVDAAQRGQQQPHTDRHGHCDQREAGDRFLAARDGEPQTEPNHPATLTAAATRPSRTMISRSAYAATRGS